MKKTPIISATVDDMVLVQPKHGGNRRYLSNAVGIPKEELLDFSANINPLGFPEGFRSLISRRIEEVLHYPDPDCAGLVGAVSACYGIPPEEIVIGNGSTELLYALPRALPKARAVIPVPSYADYATASELAGMPVEKVYISEDNGFLLEIAGLEKLLQGDEIVFLGQPNNPTGLSCAAEAIRETARRHPASIFVVDEAFADFVAGMDRLLVRRPANVIVLCSLTKFFAVPGLRLGFAAGSSDVIGKIKKLIPPWSVNVFAQAVGEAALPDDDYRMRTIGLVNEQRRYLLEELGSISGFYVYPGQANFLLVRLDRRDIDAPELARRLLKMGIAVRICDNFPGLDKRFFRIAVRNREENNLFLDALREVLAIPAKTVRKARKPAIMFQGTSSNAGKSILSAALCRILLQDGYRVAPFKSQNMSLNSYVTRDGGEMGRAQVVQAQASRLDPDVRMNPVLLKPSSDTGAQVIVMGKPVGNMDVNAYVGYKPEAFAAAQAAYDSLEEEYDAIVLEGAGSPAEVNLKHHDIVNMAMARYARATVLLVGDIDRGGVFASFVGTMEVLAEWERSLIAGFVINRFRGQEALLKDAIDYTYRHTGKPTFGVVPYIHRLGLPEEDSVTFKSGLLDTAPRGGEAVEIAVLDLPHISNFTDFDPFRIEPDVSLRIVRSAKEIGNPDALILPGSKNVIADMAYLNKSGLVQEIQRLAGEGKTELVGICGGFQILGREIADPHGLESKGETNPAPPGSLNYPLPTLASVGKKSSGKTPAGLGLLPVTTTLAREKTLKCVKGKHVESGLPVKGYEIHHGRTAGAGNHPAFFREDGEIIGVQSPDGRTWGTYLHGVFDDDAFRRWFIDGLRRRRSLAPLGKILAVYDLEPAFDRLAEIVRCSLDMEKIYRLMGLK
jgi:cobyric acid synthase CobQ/L-threonine-O-3-phosphate decarboxylase